MARAPGDRRSSRGSAAYVARRLLAFRVPARAAAWTAVLLVRMAMRLAVIAAVVLGRRRHAVAWRVRAFSCAQSCRSLHGPSLCGTARLDQARAPHATLSSVLTGRR